MSLPHDRMYLLTILPGIVRAGHPLRAGYYLAHHRVCQSAESKKPIGKQTVIRFAANEFDSGRDKKCYTMGKQMPSRPKNRFAQKTCFDADAGKGLEIVSVVDTWHTVLVSYKPMGG